MPFLHLFFPAMTKDPAGLGRGFPLLVGKLPKALNPPHAVPPPLWRDLEGQKSKGTFARMSCNDKLFPCSQEVLLSFLGQSGSFLCGKLKEEDLKAAAFLERGPIPFGKQPSNRCLCRRVWRGCVGRDGTQQSVTFCHG